MYTNFYGFRENPFKLTPSPRFLYLGEVHKEALALLTYGVVERKGFILLTGEVGTGKTTIVQALLENLDASVHCEYLSNPLLSPMNFMNYLAKSTLNRKTRFRTKTDFLIEFEVFLRSCLEEHKNFVLIIDEAQKLSFELLEEIRLLSNMETTEDKLMNIFLVGQPEINEKLNDPRCRAILQRINNRYHIRPFHIKGTDEYITTRLKIAGADKPYRIMSQNVIKEIHRLSGGYPRAINVLADNVLLLGYSRGKTRLTPDFVQECYNDSRVDTALPQESERPGQIVVEGIEGILKRLFGRYWDWATVTIISIIILVLAFVWVVKMNDKRTENSAGPAVHDKEAQAALKGGETPSKESRGQPPVETVEAESELMVLTVEEGDTLTQLAERVYPEVNEGVLNLLKQGNPGIENPDKLQVGQKIVFPPLSEKDNSASVYTIHIASFKDFKSAKKMFQDLMAKGYEVYIIPVHSNSRGKFFRVTLGNFTHQSEVQECLEKIQTVSVSDYAKPIRLEVTGFGNLKMTTLEFK